MVRRYRLANAVDHRADARQRVGEGHVAEALKLLKKLAKDDNKRVQTAVAGSLKELARKNPDEIKQAVTQWSRDKNANVRAVAEKREKPSRGR